MPEAAFPVVDIGLSKTHITTKGTIRLMSTREKLIKARLGLLALAQELQNVRLACKRAGISKSYFYEIREAYEKYGSEGLAPQPRRRPRMPNQTPPEMEQRILQMTEQYPTYSYVRISGQLRLIGVGVSPSAVRAVWLRYGLMLRIHRLLWLEQKTAAAGGVLTEHQIRLIQQHRRARWTPSSTWKHLIQATCCVRAPTSSARLRESARSTCGASWMRAAHWPSPSWSCPRPR
jgi:transposase